MQIKDKYLSKYFRDMTMEQLYDEYADKGYVVCKNKQIGPYEADLVAEKDNEKIVIEIKSGGMTSDKKQRLSDLANYVRLQGGYKFMVVTPTRPQKKRLKVENIERLLFDEISRNLPRKLEQLSVHARPDEVYDVDIDEIKIDEDTILVRGDGEISVELDYGSDSDSFPFDFAAKLNFDPNTNNFKLEDMEIDMDTSSAR
ncbi:MAG: hypothetical protein LBD35_07645 [Prevotellaceae bacterium]|nr:hypothetical protein [Prevotellaceae bacterium]